MGAKGKEEGAPGRQEHDVRVERAAVVEEDAGLGERLDLRSALELDLAVDDQRQVGAVDEGSRRIVV